MGSCSRLPCSQRAKSTAQEELPILDPRLRSAPDPPCARATRDGKNPGGWIPEEKITLPEAIEAYTMGAAFAEFQDSEKGSISPGKLADMVIVSDNIFDLKPEAIRNVKVKTTIVGGKVVYGER